MRQFTRQPSRYDIPTLRRATAEQTEARERRELAEQQRRIDAAIRAEREARPWFVRLVMGLADVVREAVSR